MRVPFSSRTQDITFDVLLASWEIRHRVIKKERKNSSKMQGPSANILDGLLLVDL